MINIKRLSCPEVLKNTPTTGRHYNKKIVVKKLWEMQHKKCCYCEQEIPESGHLKAVEHFKPQSVYKGLRNDWKNLLLACAQCNGKKSDKFPTMLTNAEGESKVLYLNPRSKSRPLLIDPSNDKIDPEEHITFIVDDSDIEKYGLPKERNHSKLGRTTINIVGLDGTYYVRKRRTWHRHLRDLYSNLLEAKDQDDSVKIQTYCDRFRQWMSAKREFCAYAREFARQKKLDLNFNITIPTKNEV